MITAKLILDILLILIVAWFFGSFFTRFGLPVMLGELLAGIALGPPLLGLIQASNSLELIAEWGILFVMFYTGMEMDPKELMEHIWSSLTVAVGGFMLPFILGFLTCKLFGGTLYQSLFVGLGVSITAIAVQSVILHSMRINQTELGHIIIGAAIADDILSLVGISVLFGLVKTGSFDISTLSLVFMKVIAFFGLTILLGHFVMPKITKNLHDREGRAFTFAVITALVMAYLAELAGLHLIIGAFLAGQFVRKEVMDEKIYESLSDRFYGLSYGFLVPVFFASLSFHLQISYERSFLLFSLVLILVAILGKLVGCGLGMKLFRHSNWASAIVGFGMNGRGAVELVVATVVINLSKHLMDGKVISEPLLTQEQFAALILMAFVTTLIAPISLKWAVMRSCRADEKVAFCTLWERAAGR
jgi:Kef-type K+ transport system membrane component KefB